MQTWLDMSAAELGRGIGAGEIDPEALAQVFLDAIDAHPLRDGIYARVTPERAMAEAAAASRRCALGLRRSPLDGVPCSWKDLFDIAGTPCEAGSALLAGRTPDRDAEVVRTASAWQVREPVHTRSIGRWRRYERQLAPLVARLRAVCAAYAPDPGGDGARR